MEADRGTAGTIGCFCAKKTSIALSQMLHVWNIFLQNWVIFGVNVGKYAIHGASGLWDG